MPITVKRANPAAVDEDSTTASKRRIDQHHHQVPNSSKLEVESSYFPSDVVIGILSRLPGKALFRFKSVCTNWDAIIPTNPHLISTHLKNYTNNPGAMASLFCTYYQEHGPNIGPSVSICAEGDHAAAQLTLDLDGGRLLEQVLCVAGNGLFLIGIADVSRPNYRLWNPATREMRQLPDPPVQPLCTSIFQRAPYVLLHTSDYGGVGVDLVAGDVKVVLIRNYIYQASPSPNSPSSVFVYTLRDNCWREVAGSYPYQDVRVLNRNMFSCHIYFEGFIYWLFKDYERDSYVVAFDMGNDVFHKINFPFDARGTCSDLILYRNSVALFKRYWDCRGYDVWLLSGGSTNGHWCWIKHSTIGRFREKVIIKGCWKDDQFIVQKLSGNQPLLLCDIDSRKTKVLIPDCSMSRRWHIYKESLLRIN